jgi:hypothetical protein
MLRRLFGGSRAPEWPADPAQAIAAGLDRLEAGPDTFAIFTSEPATDLNRYVQVATGSDGSLRGEAVSNQYLDSRASLDAGRIELLRRTGWTVEGDPRDNYSRRWESWREHRDDVANAILTTLRQVYHMPEEGPLGVSTGH